MDANSRTTLVENWIGGGAVPAEGGCTAILALTAGDIVNILFNEVSTTSQTYTFVGTLALTLIQLA
uniref:Uncharacterized protein n=1 Tax=viral metagenome TaxID=1070528 RepID=A0A6C0BQ51_9ZZZZ